MVIRSEQLWHYVVCTAFFREGLRVLGGLLYVLLTNIVALSLTSYNGRVRSGPMGAPSGPIRSSAPMANSDSSGNSAPSAPPIRIPRRR